MHRKVFYISTLALILLLLLASQPTFSPTHVQASELLQEVGSFADKNVYFAEVNGEPSRFDRSEQGLSHYAGLLRSLGANLYTLEWRKGIPADADLVIIAGPSSDLNSDQIARLWTYLNDGGRLFLLFEPSLGRNRVLGSRTGFLGLTWTDLGLNVRDDYIVTEVGTQMVEIIVESEEESEESNEETPTPTPKIDRIEVPLLSSEFQTTLTASEHPITAGLEDSMMFFSARSLEIDGSIQEVEVTPLIFTEDSFYGETNMNQYFNEGISEYNVDGDTGRGSLVLAAAFESPGRGTRMVWIGDREFITNGGGLVTSPPYSGSFVYPGNARFLLQATAWLLDVESPTEMTFPTPGPTATATTVPSPVPESESDN